MEDKITLDYKIDEELFNKTAQIWANKIKRTNKTQLRNFYEYIIDLEDKLVNKKKDKSEILPFVKMLNSKVSYARSRGVASKEFHEMMSQCIDEINNDNIEETLPCFKLFFEAVLGFFEGSN